MPAGQNQESLEALRHEIEIHLRALDHPIAVEDDVELFDLSSADWRMTLEHGKLLLEIWNGARSIVRRVEEVAYRDGARLGLFVRKSGGRESTTLELRSLRRPATRSRAPARNQFLKKFVSLLGREFPGWKIERASHGSDREHSFSSRFARGMARRGTSAWAFLALDEEEPREAADSALAFALIWLDALRSRARRETVSGLKLFLPSYAIGLNASRAAAINRRAVQLEIYECGSDGGFSLIRLDPPRPLEVRVTPRRQGQLLLERHGERFRKLLGAGGESLQIVADSSGAFLSARVHGLEIARIEGDIAPRVLFGLEGSVREMKAGRERELQEFVAQAVARRRPDRKNASDEFYRLQSERWLESLLIEDITQLDPELSPEWVYPQVPAVSRIDRGVIDILSATRAGRLGVIELKLKEEINLPLQALDYWMRVKDLNDRKALQGFGFFEGVALKPAPPLLYIVSPAFRFHSTTGDLFRYLDPSIEIRQIGINEGWREGAKVLFRKEWRAPV